MIVLLIKATFLKLLDNIKIRVKNNKIITILIPIKNNNNMTFTMFK